MSLTLQNFPTTGKADDIAPLLASRIKAGKMLDVCPRTVDALIKSGKLHPIRIGRAIRLEISELIRFIEQERGAR